MANALINYVVNEHIPTKVLDFMLALGLDADVAVPHRA